MPPDPNDMMIDPNVSNEDMDAWLAELEATNAKFDLSTVLPALNPLSEGRHKDPHESGTQSPGQEPADTTDLASTGDNVTPPTPEDEEDEEAPPTGDYFTINGRQWPREEIERLYDFDQFLRANPDAAVRVAQAVQPSAPTTQPPVPTADTPQADTPPVPPVEFQPPTPPDYLDLEDPTQRFTWETHVNTQKSLWERDQRENQRWQALQADRQAQVQTQARIDMDAALDDFRQHHPNLNEDEIAAIRQAAVPFVPGMMQTLPPQAALSRSMEVAAYMDADLIPKLIDPNTQPAPSIKQRSYTRKQRLGAISGSPRPAPKTEARPTYTSDRDMVNEFAHALAEQGFGNPNG